VSAMRIFIAAVILASCPWAYAEPGTLPGTDQAITQQWRARWEQTNSGPTAFVNRLVLSDSAYLRQHADNPVDWYPWAEETLALAKRRNQLIFLSIGYASCHWCHVMEQESFADVEVATLLNRGFIAIKVDREEHPDIDFYYVQASELVRGDAGWPVTAILTPQGGVFLVYSYVSKTELMTILSRSLGLWQDNPGWVQSNAKLIADQISERLAINSKGAAQFDPNWPEQAEQALLEQIDSEHGGFGGTAKFPSELKLHFLLNRYKQTREDALGQVLQQQLDRIIYSGLNDLVFGGVFRYTVDRALRQPHFEKMLYNQALTVSLFADAYAWFDQPHYLAFARRISGFVDEVMANGQSLNVAATDADHLGVEGGYYLWNASQVGALPDGLKSVPFGQHGIYIYPSGQTGLESKLAGRLRALRTDMPRRINNVLTAWNALWLEALIDLGQPALAAELATALWQHAWRDGVLYRLAAQPGYLDDYSYLANAFWKLYLRTGATEWKSRAGLLTQEILRRFYTQGALYYQQHKAGIPARLESYYDQVLPNAAAVALNLFRHQQSAKEFWQAIGLLEARAYSSVERHPENFLTLVERGGAGIPGSNGIIASGHGIVRLSPAVENDAWKLDVHLESGWHINASRVLNEFLIPTRVTATGDDPALIIKYPQGVLISTEFSEEPLLLYQQDLTIEVSTAANLPRLWVQLRLQACNNEMCLPPENLLLTAARNSVSILSPVLSKGKISLGKTQ